MEKQKKTNNDLNALYVKKLISGENVILNSSMNKPGLDYGSKRAIQYGNYTRFQAIANQNLNELKIIGLKNHPVKILISKNVNMCFLMVLIFTKMVA